MTDESATAGSIREEIQRQIAERLRLARKERELSIDDAASRLNIRAPYLRAFESGDWSDMPEDVYTLGFLRQYAHFLGENIDDVMTQLKSDEFHLTRPFTMPDPAIAPKQHWVVAAAVLLMLLLVIFNINRQPQGTVNQAVDVPQTVPAPPSPDISTEAAPKPAPLDETQQAADQAGQGEEEMAVTKKLAPSPSSPPIDAPLHRYAFKAVDEVVWLQVFDMEGALLHEALLQSGERLAVSHGGGGLLVTCGNAAALEIQVDDELVAAAGTLGKHGEVVRRLKVQPPNTPPGP